MIKIWGRNNSINVQKVLWCCDELGLAYERIDAGAQFGVVDTPAYRKLNPNGLVPAIEDGGFVLWESNAIVRYLAAKHGAGKLWPQDLRVRADADRWMDWHMSVLWHSLRPLFVELVRRTPDKRDPKVVQAAHKATTDAMQILEACLSGRDYVAGADFTIGDIPVGSAVYRWMNLPVERVPLPRIDAWYGRLQQRPAYRRHIMLPMS